MGTTIVIVFFFLQQSMRHISVLLSIVLLGEWFFLPMSLGKTNLSYLWVISGPQ